MKYIVVTILLFACAIPCRSQTIADQVQKAITLFQERKFEEAMLVAEKAAPEVKTLMGENNMIYMGLVTIQAFGYSKTYQYAKAISTYTALCEIQRKNMGEKTDHYAACLNNLATVYSDMGLYDKAEPLLIRSMEITKSLVGDKDSAYSYSLNNLAALYHSIGQYQKAEPLYLQAKEIRERVYGIEHPAYASSLNNLGTLYMEMGQTQLAEPLFIKARDIWKKTYGEWSDDYAMSLNNLASLYEEKEQFAKAEPMYIQSQQIRKKSKGEHNPDYAMSLNNLASLYAKMKQYKKSETYLLQARDTWKAILGEDHPNYATSLNNLAALYRKAKIKFPEAEQLYKECIALRKKVLGASHPLTADSENDIALLYSGQKLFAKAEPYFLSSTQSLLQNMRTGFTILSDKEKSNYLNYNYVLVESNLSYLFNNPKASSQALINCYNLQLGYKSLSLADTRNMLAAVRNSPDTTIRRLLNQWQVNKLVLSKQYALATDQRMKNLSQIEDETEKLEKELNRKSTAFRNQQAALQVTMNEVQDKMEENEAAIEFVRFKLYTDYLSDTVIYAAFVLKKHDAAPAFVPICSKIQLQKLFDSAGKSTTTQVSSFYRGLEKKTGNESRLGRRLYTMVWSPLEPFLQGIKKISYTPAGKLYGVAFHAIQVDSSLLLIDKYELQQYTSTRQIALRTQAGIDKPGSVVLFGDPQFTMDSTAIAAQKKPTTNSSSTLLASRGQRGGVWVDLPGTGEEVKQISSLFAKNNIQAKVFVKENASEENLKLLDGKSPRILHMATHGFFLPDPDSKKAGPPGNSYSMASDPLMRSGIVLSGGNYVWSGKRPIEGIEDGVVTAYEISQLNLSSTDLVVLSACETGLGDVKGSEGVFGLQRSFKMAGVKNIVVSLWQVPDIETVELMNSFYTYRLSGKPVRESFYLAQAEMRKKYPPYFWAAFVLVE